MSLTRISAERKEEKKEKGVGGFGFWRGWPKVGKGFCIGLVVRGIELKLKAR